MDTKTIGKEYGNDVIRRLIEIYGPTRTRDLSSYWIGEYLDRDDLAVDLSINYGLTSARSNIDTCIRCGTIIEIPVGMSCIYLHGLPSKYTE